MYMIKYMCTKGLLDFYFLFHGCCSALRSLTYKIFGGMHSIYYYDGNDTTNITLNYHTNILMDKYQDGIYHVRTSDESTTRDFIVNGAIDDVETYMDTYERHNFLNKSYQNMISPDLDFSKRRKSFLLLNGDETLNLDFNIVDDYMNYVANEYRFIKVIDLETILKILYDVICTHIVFVRLVPFQRIKHEIRDVTIDMIYT